MTGGFISSWHGVHVNVVELPSSFESTLMHFGCEPSAILLFSQALEEKHSCIFSVHTIILERVFIEIVHEIICRDEEDKCSAHCPKQFIDVTDTQHD